MTTNLKLMNYGAVCVLDRKQQNRKPLLKMRTQIKKKCKVPWCAVGRASSGLLSLIVCLRSMLSVKERLAEGKLVKNVEKCDVIYFALLECFSCKMFVEYEWFATRNSIKKLIAWARGNYSENKVNCLGGIWTGNVATTNNQNMTERKKFDMSPKSIHLEISRAYAKICSRSEELGDWTEKNVKFICAR